MPTIELLSIPTCQRLALTLLHFLWQGLAVAAVAVAGVRLLKLRHGPRRYAAYLLAMIVMAACPVATFCLVDAPDPATRPAETQIVETLAPVEREAPETDAPAPVEHVDAAPAVVDVPAAADVPEEAPLPELDHDVAGGNVAATGAPGAAKRYLEAGLPWVTAAWLIGVLALSVRLLMGIAGLRRWRRRLEALPAHLAAAAATLGERMGLAGFGRVFISPAAAGPMVVGYLRPMVLLPAAMLTNLPPEMLEAILAHELAHVRRLDLWVNLFQRVAETLLFYHPAVWWLSGRLRSERELCCDELAVAATGERVAYASALEQAYRDALSARQPSLAAGLGARKNNILARVRHVLGLASSPTRSRWWLAGALSLLSVIAIATGLGISHAAEQGPPATPSAADPPRRALNDVTKPFVLDRPVPLILSAEAGGQAKAAELRWAVFRQRDGKIEAYFQRILRTPPKGKWKVGVQFLDARGRKLRSRQEVFDTSKRSDGTLVGGLVVDMGKVEDPSAIASFRVTISPADHRQPTTIKLGPSRWISLDRGSGGRRVFTLGDRKAAVYGEKLVFFSGPGDDAKPVAEVDCRDQRITVSRGGKYVALCSQFIGSSGPARVYDNAGKAVGQFHLPRPWKITAVSDSGPMVALGKERHGISPSVVRLCNASGKVLADYDSAHVYFTAAGTPIVWGERPGRRKMFVAVLDDRGSPRHTYEYPDRKVWVSTLVASGDASRVALFEHPRLESFADRLTLWTPKTNARQTVPRPKGLGAFQPQASVSPNGSYVAFRLGGAGIGLIRASDASVRLARDMSAALPNGVLIENVREVSVSNDGSMRVRCLIVDDKGAHRGNVKVDAAGHVVGWSPVKPPSAPATQPAAAEQEQGWGTPRDGLRCRWVPPSGPIAAGTTPVLVVEVQNVSDKPILWECESESVWGGMHVAGIVDWPSAPKFRVKPGKRARLATAGEVRQRFSAGRPGLKDEDPMGGYYHILPGGKITLVGTLPRPLDKPGRYHAECMVFRRSPFGSHARGFENHMTCVPIVLAVVDAAGNVPDADPTTWPAGPWGQKVEGMQIRLVADKSFLNPGRNPHLSVDARNFGKRAMRLFAERSFDLVLRGNVQMEVDGVWYGSLSARPSATRGKRWSAYPFGPGNRYTNVVFSSGLGWRSKTGAKLTFRPGRHTIRLAVTVHPARGSQGKPVRLVSNAIQPLPPKPLPRLRGTPSAPAGRGPRQAIRPSSPADIPAQKKVKIPRDAIVSIEKTKKATTPPSAQPAGPARVNLRGRVLAEPGGRGVGGIHVILQTGLGFGMEDVTGPDGSYQFAPPASKKQRPMWLRVSDGSRPHGTWAPSVMAHVADKDVRAPDLHLRLPQSISGVVRDAKSKAPVGGLNVGFAGGKRVRADAQGRFRLYLPPGVVKLRCDGAWVGRYFADKQDKRVALVAGSHVKDVDLLVTSAPKMTGVVVFADGKPVPDAEVWLEEKWQSYVRIAGEYSMMRDLQRLKTNKVGVFTAYLRGRRGDAEKEPMKVRAIAFSSDRTLSGSAEAIVGSPRPGLLKIVLGKTARLVVRVIGDDGKPVRGAKLEVDSQFLTFHEQPATWSVKHVGDGRYEALLVAGLDYRVWAWVRGFPLHHQPVRRVSPKPGEQLDAGTLTLVRFIQGDVPDLVRRLSSPKERTRENAGVLLGHMGPRAAPAVPALIGRLKDPWPPVRNAAVYALGRIGPAAREAVPELVRVLREDFGGPRGGAAKALGSIGDPRALPSLRDALTDKTRFLAKRAAEAIRRIEQSRTRPATTQPTGKGAE